MGKENQVVVQFAHWTNKDIKHSFFGCNELHDIMNTFNHCLSFRNIIKLHVYRCIYFQNFKL